MNRERQTSTTILLVRHGETEWNRGKIFRGTHDIPLNENGRNQARSLAPVMPPIDAAFTSPLSRAVETAQLALAEQDCATEKHAGLIDFNYGEWTGLEDDVVEEKCPEEHACWVGTPHLAHPPGGDTLVEVSARAMAALHEIVSAHEGRTVALFAHRVVNKLLVMGMLGLDIERFPFIRQDNGCLDEFVSAGEDFVAVRINDTSHLRELDVLGEDF